MQMTLFIPYGQKNVDRYLFQIPGFQTSGAKQAVVFLNPVHQSFVDFSLGLLRRLPISAQERFFYITSRFVCHISSPICIFLCNP